MFSDFLNIIFCENGNIIFEFGKEEELKSWMPWEEIKKLPFAARGSLLAIVESFIFVSYSKKTRIILFIINTFFAF